jgi:hypothetical protein
MKKLSLVLVALILISSATFCATPQESKYSIGLENPCFAWLIKDDQKQVTGKIGINLGIGVGYKNYFLGPVKTNQFNAYFTLGTILLILPYIGAGGDYVWDNGFYLGAGVVYLFPEIHGGFMF